ncbi:MAG: hypothetical protein AB8B65_18945 [Kordia sp.]|uniref:hypothetical protein n=1 Tax=Kordia sp. TaxID=1965332 RepID=UPI0038594C38
MKKTLLITSAIFAFFCFSCDDELLDPNVVIEESSSNGGNTGGGNNGGNNNGGNNNGGNNGSALSAYSLDTNSNVPIFGEIITNTDFVVNNGLVVSANIQATALGFTTNAISTLTRDGNGKVVQVEGMESGSVTSRTTITYTGDNITQIAYEDLGDSTENYTYTFAYSGTTVTRTNAAANQSAVFTFNSNSQLISKESFDGTTSTQLEVLTYVNGNCTNSTVTGANTGNNTFVYDSFTNPLNSVFNDQFLFSMFDSENDSEVGSVLATFHGTNNWIRIETNDGNVDLTVTYNANDDITSRDGNFDLGDGVVITQSEAFQY